MRVRLGQLLDLHHPFENVSFYTKWRKTSSKVTFGSMSRHHYRTSTVQVGAILRKHGLRHPRCRNSSVIAADCSSMRQPPSVISWTLVEPRAGDSLTSQANQRRISKRPLMTSM